MAFTGQSFSFQQVLTSAEMNQMDTNIDEVRTQHKGPSAPAGREAGVLWLDDDPAPWTWRMYKNGSTSIPLCQIDPTNDRVLYPTDTLVIPWEDQILYIDESDVEQTLIGIHPTAENTWLEIPRQGLRIDVTSPAGTTLLEIRATDEAVSSGGTGQLQLLNGTPRNPSYSFMDGTRAGMYYGDSFNDGVHNYLGFSPGNTGLDYNFHVALIDTVAGVGLDPPSLPGLFIGKQVSSFGAVGAQLVTGNSQARGQIRTTVDSGVGLLINRTSNDGQLVVFYRDGTEVGDISVSAGEVSLTGAHLARLSQLPGGAEPRPIPRGTVMAVSSEMAQWITVVESGIGRRPAPEALGAARLKKGYELEANEQLMRSDISRTPGERAIYGVFDRWSQSDGWDRDFYLATTGDFLCRVTGPCGPGDLLESAGDGTARVQSDDLLRASTLARVSMGFATATASEENLVPVQLMIG